MPSSPTPAISANVAAANAAYVASLRLPALTPRQAVTIRELLVRADDASDVTAAA